MKYEGLLVKPKIEKKDDGFYVSARCFYYLPDDKGKTSKNKEEISEKGATEAEALGNFQKELNSMEIQLTKSSQESLQKLLSTKKEEPEAIPPATQKIEEKVSFEYEGVLFIRSEKKQDGIYVDAQCYYIDKKFNANILNIKTKGPYKTEQEYLEAVKKELAAKKIKLLQKPLEEILKDLGFEQK